MRNSIFKTLLDGAVGVVMTAPICKMTKLRRLRLGSAVGAVMPMVVSFTAITTAASLYTFKIVQNAQRQAAYVAKKNHIESFKLRLMQALDGDNCKGNNGVLNTWNNDDDTEANWAETGVNTNADNLYSYITAGSGKKIQIGSSPYSYGDRVGGGLELIHLGIKHWKCDSPDNTPDARDYPDMIALCDQGYSDGTNHYKWGVIEFALKDAASGVGLPAQHIPVLWVYEDGAIGKLKQCFAGARTLSCRQMGGCGYTVSNGSETESKFACDIQSVIESEQGGCSFGGYYSLRWSDAAEKVGECHAANPITCKCKCPNGYAPTKILGLQTDKEGNERVAMYSCVRCLDQCGNVIRVNSCDLNFPGQSDRARRPQYLRMALLNSSSCANTNCFNASTADLCRQAGGTWNTPQQAPHYCSGCSSEAGTPRCGRESNKRNASLTRNEEDSCERQYYEGKCSQCCNDAGGESMGDCSHFCDQLSGDGLSLPSLDPSSCSR